MIVSVSERAHTKTIKSSNFKTVRDRSQQGAAIIGKDAKAINGTLLGSRLPDSNREFQLATHELISSVVMHARISYK